MDNVTIDRIKLMHPDKRDSLRQIYININNQLPKGVRLRFTHTLRTIEEQNYLYSQGRTRGGSIVTNAKGGQSIHNYGLAIDIVILLDEDNNGTFEKAVWNGTHFNFVVKELEKLGFEWGGRWKFKDAPNFQYKKANGTSFKWQELKALLDNGKLIKNNSVNYPII
jgi:peptidoglycan L-alanyl-D-glutamate endopeptidase CwlK